jgi:hypothetical protein
MGPIGRNPPGARIGCLRRKAITAKAGQVSTVFKGETLRSMLLNAYGWWKVSQITYIISLAAFGLGAAAGLGSIFLFVTGRRNNGTQV